MTRRPPNPQRPRGSWPSGRCSPRRARPGGNWRRNRPLAGLPNRRHFGRDKRCPARRGGPVAPGSRRKGRARSDHRDTVRGRRDGAGGGRVVLWHPDGHIPTHCLGPTIHLRHKVSLSWAYRLSQVFPSRSPRTQPSPLEHLPHPLTSPTPARAHTHTCAAVCCQAAAFARVSAAGMIAPPEAHVLTVSF